MTATPAPRGRVGDLLLWVTAALGAVCLLAAVAASALDVRPLVFRSGSMSPAMDTGALALARTVPAADVQLGDVVSVHTAEGVRVTHRVVGMQGTGGERSLVLQGDANPSPDSEPYRVSSADRVLVDVPYLGYAVERSGHPLVLVGLGAVLAAGVLTLRRPSRDRGGRRRAAPQRRGRAVTTVAVVGAVGLGAAVVAGVPQVRTTLAAFSDSAVVTSGAFTPHTLTVQATPACSNQGGVIGLAGFVRVTWSHVDTRYDYAWEVRRTSDGAVRASGVTAGAGAVGATLSHDVTASLLNPGITSTNFDFVLRPRLKGTPTWVAGASTSTRIHNVNVLGLGLSMRCGPI